MHLRIRSESSYTAPTYSTTCGTECHIETIEDFTSITTSSARTNYDPVWQLKSDWQTANELVHILGPCSRRQLFLNITVHVITNDPLSSAWFALV